MRAWLDLKPKDSKKKNSEIYNIGLPEIPDDYCYLPAFLSKSGIVAHGINGLTPLPFSEIEAWSRMENIKLTPFESSCIRGMSESFASIANNPDSECPLGAARITSDQEAANIAAWKALCK